MKINYKITLLLILLMCFNYILVTAQNVGINTVAPDASAILDITHTNRGLLIPRIALTATNVSAPVIAPALSLLVFNTAAAGAPPNEVTPGYYYWNGAKWVGISAGNAWQLLGNAGTTAGTNFIGTTDATDFVIKTNNIEQARILSTGNVGIGTTTPTEKLQVQGNLYVSGKVYNPSDRRYKEHITTIPNALSSVAKLRGVTYTIKNEFKNKGLGTGIQVGVIAQELEQVYPQLVQTDSTGYKAVDYAKLCPILIEAIKELKTQNEALKTVHTEQMHMLHTRIKALEKKQ
jgi:Chaperone of endosialidase